MASMIRALAALLVAWIALPAAAAEFRWTDVGGDPCNPNPPVNCTLDWALGKTGWPSAVKMDLIEMVGSSRYANYEVKPGWRGWMTWGKYHRKFKPNTVAAWKERAEPAKLWVVNHGGKGYYLIRVVRCNNWGGWIGEPIPMPAVPSGPVVSGPPAAPAVPNLMPIGILPEVMCPP